MSNDYFNQRKESILNKQDKSFKGNWDKKIVNLCKKINLKNNYYTTSSCSGRVVLMFDKEEKKNNLFIQIYHDLINFKQLKRDLNKIESDSLIKFKQEPCILHIACKSLEDAKFILGKARFVGLKRSGIIATEKRFIVELLSTEKLEFPIINKGKILVDDYFLKLIIKKSNFNLKKSWEKIDKLEELIYNC